MMGLITASHWSVAVVEHTHWLQPSVSVACYIYSKLLLTVPLAKHGGLVARALQHLRQKRLLQANTPWGVPVDDVGLRA